MRRQRQTTTTPNAHIFPSSSHMLYPQHQSFYNMVTFLPQPSPPINPPPAKRLRTLQTPTDHKRLCHIKKLERDTVKSMTPCTTHQTGMIEVPYQILKCVQAQGITLCRTNETVEYLRDQVTSLHEMVKTALRSFKSSSKDGSTMKAPHPLLPSYLTLVTQTLEAFKTNPPPSNALQSTAESINKLHQLILLQCSFDSLLGLPKESNGSSNRLTLPASTPPTTPTLDSVLKPLQKMESNLKKWLNLQGTTKKEGNGTALAKISQNKDEPSGAVAPPLQSPSPTTSTPIKTNHQSRVRHRRSFTEKRKVAEGDEDVDYGIGTSFGNLSVIPYTTNTRELLHPTRHYSLSYMPNSMDVD